MRSKLQNIYLFIRMENELRTIGWVSAGSSKIKDRFLPIMDVVEGAVTVGLFSHSISLIRILQLLRIILNPLTLRMKHAFWNRPLPIAVPLWGVSCFFIFLLHTCPPHSTNMALCVKEPNISATLFLILRYQFPESGSHITPQHKFTC